MKNAHFKSEILLLTEIPEDLHISPYGPPFYDGDILECSGSGNPSPNYQWFDSQDLKKDIGGAFIVLRPYMTARTFICKAEWNSGTSKNISVYLSEIYCE